MPKTITHYFVVPAPGHYGDRATVVSAHRTREAAIKAAGPGFVAREGPRTRGDTWLRVDERFYPLAVR